MFKSAVTKAEETRRRLLEIALALFRKRGFEATTMREVAAVAGLSLGAAYYHFESKEAIVAAYYHHVQAEHRRRAEAAFASARSYRARLGVAMHTKLDILHDDRKLLVALFRYGGDPKHPLSWFGPATRSERKLSMEIFDRAVGDERLPADVREIAPVLLWTLHMGFILYFLYDTSAGQAKTRKLVDGALDWAVRGQRVASLPLMKPFRKRTILLLREAGLVP